MRINVKVIPGAKKDTIEEDAGGLRVHMRAAAIEGRANKQLIEMLAEHYKTKKYRITITRGSKSREKIIDICETD
ncbi:MAG: DUF167 domain-containing protein [Candidatus Omnitrophota bacterium]|nr:DUF167 domain-containing protein [Candidatus Omnitrophota bacterium]